MTRPKLLDLFCGAGGAAMGYHQAGFAVVGVDRKPQSRYPFEFHQDDALDYLAVHGHEYDAIHASPPCQVYSSLRHFAARVHGNFVPQTQEMLRGFDMPWVIENVVGAPLDTTLMLCGSMFGLGTKCGAELRRHRLFESNIMLMSPGACRHGTYNIICVAGTSSPRDSRVEWQKRRPGPRKRTISVTGATPQQNVVRNVYRQTYSIDAAREAMGIDWMVMAELSQAIPPAYTKWIGKQLIRAVK